MNEFLLKYRSLGERFDPNQVKINNCLRVNTYLIKEETLIKRMRKKGVTLKKIPYLKNGYTYQSEFSLGSTPEYLLGYYYLQEAASQAPVQILQPKKGEKILDMAAAPGGKTTQILQYIKNDGFVLGLDIRDDRLKSTKNNIERLGFTSYALLNKDGRFVHDLGEKFDKVLLDAPCSGNFCIEPDYFKIRSESDIYQKARTQKQLIRGAIKTTKKGGQILYSTCSLEPEENELVINWALEKFDVSIMKTNFDKADNGITKYKDTKLHPTLKLAKRFWPHKTNTQGFFVCKLQKNF